MANVWELITTSSGLPIQAGNSLWNHLNNLGLGGGGGTIYNIEGFEIEVETLEYEIFIEPDYLVEIDDMEVIIEVDYTDNSVLIFNEEDGVDVDNN